jgi:hypothetical protein
MDGISIGRFFATAHRFRGGLGGGLGWHGDGLGELGGVRGASRHWPGGSGSPGWKGANPTGGGRSLSAQAWSDRDSVQAIESAPIESGGRTSSIAALRSD